MSGGGEKMKRTYQPNNRKKSKKLGFFARKKTNILNKYDNLSKKITTVFFLDKLLPIFFNLCYFKIDYLYNILF